MLPNCQNFSDQTRGKKTRNISHYYYFGLRWPLLPKNCSSWVSEEASTFSDDRKNVNFGRRRNFTFPEFLFRLRFRFSPVFFSKPAALKREAKENNLGWVALGWFRGLPKWHLISSLGFSVRNPHWLLFYNLMNRPYLMDIFFKAFLVSKYP